MNVNQAAAALAVSMVLALATALGFYMRTSYREGGWKQVRRDLLWAIVAVLVFGVANHYRAMEAQDLGKAVSDFFMRK